MARHTRAQCPHVDYQSNRRGNDLDDGAVHTQVVNHKRRPPESVHEHADEQHHGEGWDGVHDPEALDDFGVLPRYARHVWAAYQRCSSPVDSRCSLVADTSGMQSDSDARKREMARMLLVKGLKSNTFPDFALSFKGHTDRFEEPHAGRPDREHPESPDTGHARVSHRGCQTFLRESERRTAGSHRRECCVNR